MNQKDNGDNSFFQRKTIASKLKSASNIYLILSLIGAVIIVIYYASEFYGGAVTGLAIAIPLAIIAYFIAMLIYAAGEAIHCLQIIADSSGQAPDEISAVAQKETELKAIESELPDL